MPRTTFCICPGLPTRWTRADLPVFPGAIGDESFFVGLAGFVENELSVVPLVDKILVEEELLVVEDIQNVRIHDDEQQFNSSIVFANKIRLFFQPSHHVYFVSRGASPRMVAASKARRMLPPGRFGICG